MGSELWLGRVGVDVGIGFGRVRVGESWGWNNVCDELGLELGLRRVSVGNRVWKEFGLGSDGVGVGVRVGEGWS